MYEVTHLPTGVLCGYFRNFSDAEFFVKKLNHIEGIEIGIFGDNVSLGSGVYEEMLKIYTETKKRLGDLTNWNLKVKL